MAGREPLAYGAHEFIRAMGWREPRRVATAKIPVAPPARSAAVQIRLVRVRGRT
jgi:hypothetical protein